jgi:CBS domain-containing protein
MSIATLANPAVVTVAEETDLVVAAQRMREKHVGLLVVTRRVSGGGEEPVGIVTDRDIVVGVVAREADARALRVGDVMSHAPITVGRATGIAETLARMRETGLRRMPVVDEAGRLVGLVAMDDLVDYVARLLGDVAGAIRNEQRIERAVRA